ncbi:MAG TPA: hypothetical protein DCO75_13495, partial [Fibrobacteres bacterium]|nr:hypothetical protein [Fibrobacterota bacterium]
MFEMLPPAGAVELMIFCFISIIAAGIFFMYRMLYAIYLDINGTSMRLQLLPYGIGRILKKTQGRVSALVELSIPAAQRNSPFPCLIRKGIFRGYYVALA